MLKMPVACHSVRVTACENAELIFAPREARHQGVCWSNCSLQKQRNHQNKARPAPSPRHAARCAPEHRRHDSNAPRNKRQTTKSSGHFRCLENGSTINHRTSQKAKSIHSSTFQTLCFCTKAFIFSNLHLGWLGSSKARKRCHGNLNLKVTRLLPILLSTGLTLAETGVVSRQHALRGRSHRPLPDDPTNASNFRGGGNLGGSGGRAPGDPALDPLANTHSMTGIFHDIR